MLHHIITTCYTALHAPDAEKIRDGEISIADSVHLSHYELLAFRAPSTASRSAASLPTLLECPLIHSKSLRAPSFCRSSIFVRILSTKSLFSTGFPAAVLHPFLLQLMYQFVTQSIAYLLSVMMLASLLRGTISSARRMAVSSAR